MFWGAIYGQGEGRQGNSYGLPTKRSPYECMSATEVQGYVETFLEYAKSKPDEIFLLTAIGTGYGGHKVQAIAPMFRGAPVNVLLPRLFMEYLDGNGSEAWDVPKITGTTAHLVILDELRVMSPIVQSGQTLTQQPTHGDDA